MGDKNVVSMWYHMQDEAKHNGSANVHCFNPIFYRQFFYNIERVRAYFAEFTHYKRSLQGIDPPRKEKIIKFGFNDTNIALVNTTKIL